MTKRHPGTIMSLKVFDAISENITGKLPTVDVANRTIKAGLGPIFT